jgi:hypothetical protein
LSVALVPVGPAVKDPAIAAILRSQHEAILELQQPARPVRLPNIATKALLPDPDAWRECAAVCDEINAIVVSTAVAGVYTWLRADGGAL